MSMLAKIFGGREVVASAAIQKEIAAVERHLEGATARLAKVTDRLADPSMMSADDHSAADTESRELSLAIVRFKKQLEKLADALSKAKAAEALDDLKARAKDLRRGLDRDIPKALDDYEAAAAAVAGAVERYEAVRLSIERINSELHAAGLDTIDTPEGRHRKVAGTVTPARFEKRKFWVREVMGSDGRSREQKAMLFGVDEKGEQVPVESGFYPVMREVQVTPEHRVPDEWLPSLSHNLVLPPSRAGRSAHWPRPQF